MKKNKEITLRKSEQMRERGRVRGRGKVRKTQFKRKFNDFKVCYSVAKNINMLPSCAREGERERAEKYYENKTK